MYSAGECLSGSSAGMLYVSVPNAYDSGTYNTGQTWLVAPYVIDGFPGGGATRRQIYSTMDLTSQGSQSVGYALTALGEHYPYSDGASPADNSAALPPAHQTQRWGSMGLLAAIPVVVQDTQNRTQFSGVQLQIPAGLAYAEVQLSYSRFIGLNTSPVGNFFCTERQDGCNTNSLSGAPFAFESETSTAASCASGCRSQCRPRRRISFTIALRRSSTGTGSLDRLGYSGSWNAVRK